MTIEKIIEVLDAKLHCGDCFVCPIYRDCTELTKTGLTEAIRLLKEIKNDYR